MVETWHPNGRLLSSHRSDPCTHKGHIFGLLIGARIWTLDVFGTQVEDWTFRLASLTKDLSLPLDTSCSSLVSNTPSILVEASIDATSLKSYSLL